MDKEVGAEESLGRLHTGDSGKRDDLLHVLGGDGQDLFRGSGFLSD